MHPLSGKVALITGASSGIGQAAAVRLADHGVAVALAARNRQALDETGRRISAAGGRALAAPTDVTDSEQVRRAVEATIAQFGQLDILLCSAGLSLRAYFEGTAL